MAMRPFQFCSAFLVSGLCAWALFGGEVFARSTRFIGVVAKPSCYYQANESFLSNTREIKAFSLGKQLNRTIFDSDLIRELGPEYLLLVKDYDVQKHYEPGDSLQEKAFLERMTSFTHRAFQKIKSFHSNKGLSKARNAVTQLITSSDDPAIRTVKKPVATALIVAAAGMGTPMPLYTDGDSQLTLRTDLRTMVGNLSLLTPWVNGNIELNRSEHYRISLSRNLPYLNVDSGVSYSGTSTLLTSSLSKEVFSNLRCEVASSRQLKPEKLADHHGEGAVKLLYGVNF